VFILDGTTFTLPPTPALKKAFPPATNQHGESVWPVAMLMVASELSTGCILTPQIGAMYGPNNTSEAAQAERIADRLPSNALVLADSAICERMRYLKSSCIRLPRTMAENYT
jgi:hypothetical protein